MSVIKHSKPFLTYVLTHSALVLIILAASYLIRHLLSENYAISVDRIWISMALIVVVQLPVAAVYARRETSDVSLLESGTLTTVFICITMLVEVALQSMGNTVLHFTANLDVLTDTDQATLLNIGLVGMFLGFTIAVSFVRSIFRLADKYSDIDDEYLATCGTSEIFNRPNRDVDFCELYRRELVAINIAIFGFGLVFFNAEFVRILQLSIPLSLVFSVFCVANRLARSNTKTSLSQRCLHISIQLLPLSVTSLILLFLASLYTDFASATQGVAGPLEYASFAVAYLGGQQVPIVQMMVFLAVIFSVCLAANTLMLVLFTKLIRPIFSRSLKSKRPVGDFNDVSADFPSDEAFNLAKGTDIGRALKQRGVKTCRPETRVMLGLG
jgi:hypothetical protein